jgi:hypothetical protein
MTDRKESVAASGAPSGRLLMLPKHLPTRRSRRRVSNEEAQKKYPNGWKAPTESSCSGTCANAHERQLILAPDLKETLAAVDQFEIDALKKIDDYIRRVGLAAPTENIPRLLDGYREEEVTELSLQGVGISTVVWATGYAFDFSLVKLPVVDSDAPLATHTACWPMRELGLRQGTLPVG